MSAPKSQQCTHMPAWSTTSGSASDFLPFCLRSTNTCTPSSRIIVLVVCVFSSKPRPTLKMSGITAVLQNHTFIDLRLFLRAKTASMQGTCQLGRPNRIRYHNMSLDLLTCRLQRLAHIAQRRQRHRPNILSFLERRNRPRHVCCCW